MSRRTNRRDVINGSDVQLPDRRIESSAIFGSDMMISAGFTAATLQAGFWR
jgi:hypothetical protein